MKRYALILIAILLTAVLMVAGDGVKWINVHVTEPGEETTVEVHLPLSLVGTAMECVKTEEFKNGKINLHLENTEVDVVKLIQEIKKAPDGEYVKVKDKDANVVVRKEKGTIYIHVTENGEEKANVNVVLPARLLDAVRVDANNELDVKSLIAALGDLGTGDLVTVEADDAHVRVWIE